jgi:hypothetical protein
LFSLQLQLPGWPADASRLIAGYQLDLELLLANRRVLLRAVVPAIGGRALSSVNREQSISHLHTLAFDNSESAAARFAKKFNEVIVQSPDGLS